ncbi:MAG: hypothetical protein EA374_03810 [Acholeplasmatales bacterium]|nr:MAG: hypothetical protein EA374_03810 [Acholeplasmatales bacterium]
MKFTKIKRINLIVSFLALLMAFGVTTFAWIDQSTRIPSDVIGKTRNAYFACGDGSAEFPFHIDRAVHFFNLSFLQNLGIFDDDIYHFKVSDCNGNRVEIDFNAPNVIDVFRTIQPIGTETHPFNGQFDGHTSVLKGYTVNGYGFQDVGTFGFVGPDAKIYDLFLEAPTILSHPDSLIDSSGFTERNDGHINLATGYIVGYLSEFAELDFVFVIAPEIQSLMNNFANRSQYGLIGFNEADGGNIAGGPREQAYDFAIDAISSYNALMQARSAYSNWIVSGSGGLSLNQVLNTGNPSPNPPYNIDLAIPGPGTPRGTTPPYNNTFSLSTMQITNPSTNETVFLYDQMVADNNPIKSVTNGVESFYNRENIDLVGFIGWDNNDIVIREPRQNFTIPAIGSTFNPLNYNRSILLYVRPSGDNTALGEARGAFSQAGSMGFASGFDINTGAYREGGQHTYEDWGGANVTSQLDFKEALTAVREDSETGQFIVVDAAVETPDYFIFAVISSTNGFKAVQKLEFSYIPAAINADSLSGISNIDFLHSVNDVLDLADPREDYVFSFVNFGYSLSDAQGINITTARNADGSYRFDFNYVITDNSFFFLDFINLFQYDIKIFYDNDEIYSGTNQIIEVRLEGALAPAVTGRNLPGSGP